MLGRLVTSTGLEIMRGMASGAIDPPPVAILLGMRFEEAGDGYVRFSMEARPSFANPQGTIHGGIAATLLDTVMTCAAFTKLPAGSSCTTTDLNVQFVRAIAPDGGALVAEGRAVNVGKTRGQVRAEMTDAAGRLVAFATGGIAVLAPRLPDA